FFQAEDGIRDRNVTGVQTCALPIFKTSVVAVLSTIILTACSLPGLGGSSENGISIVSGSTTERQILGYLVEGMVNHYTDAPTNRSEERRVGKEENATVGRGMDMSRR